MDALLFGWDKPSRYVSSCGRTGGQSICGSGVGGAEALKLDLRKTTSPAVSSTRDVSSWNSIVTFSECKYSLSNPFST